MDVTTLALAVDSSQVNNASLALQKMATEGLKAETVAAKFANTAQLQGRAINSGIVKNAAAAADSIKGLTSATSALASAKDFSATTAGLAAAAAEANTAAVAVRAFGAAIAASAGAGAGLAASFQAPAKTTVQQIAQAPVSALARSAQPATSLLASVDIDSRPTVAATNALDKYADHAAKAKNAAEGLTSAAQEQGRALAAGIAPGAGQAAAGLLGTASAMSAAAVQANAAAAAFGNAQAAAAKASVSASGFNPFGGVGGGVAAKATTGAASVGAAPVQTTAFATAAANAAKQSTALGQANKLTANQTQKLSYQMHDFFVQVTSGQSPLTAFIQQGSQLSGTFGGAGGALRAVTSLITPMAVGLTAAATAVGTLGYAYYEGTKQSKAFADSLVLSGNFAGQTEGQFNALAKAIAASGQVTVGASREFAQALISTGQIGPEVLALATEAATKYGAATGKTADEIAADFAKMSRAPSEFAKEANRSLNNLTAAQYASMKSFEENGKAADAQGIFYRALIERLNGLEPNLTRLDRILRDGKVAWSNFWDAAAGSGRGDTTEAKLSTIAARIAAAQRSANDAPSIGAYGGPRPSGQATVSALLAEQAALQNQQASEIAVAAEKAKQAALQKSGIAAKDYIDKALKAAKAGSALNEELAENARQIKAAATAGTPYSKEDAALLDKNTRKKFAGPKGPANNEASQVLREQLADDLNVFKAALDAEKATLAFHEKEMQALYQAGGISLKALFEDKRQSIVDGVKIEKDELDKEIARLKEYQAQIKDPSEKVKVQKQINQFGVQKEKLQTAADRNVSLTNKEEEASFRQLNDQIANYRANLLQMQGDELGAARARAEIAKDNAGILSRQSGGKISQADVDRQSALTEAANKFADVQRKAGDLAQNTARAEEAANLASETGGKSLLETENAVYAVRSRAVDQLGILAAKARELAEASTDPKIKQFAADLALQYAKAADAIDPALNRLREAQKELAAGIAGNLNQGLATLPQEYSKRRQDANKEAKEEKDRFDRRIEIQQGYLAQAASNEERARIRKRIKDLEAQRESVNGESKGNSLLQAVNTNIVQPMASQAFATVNKLLVTDPLQKYLEGQFRSMTEGGGVFAGFFKDALGIKDPKTDANGAILAQAAAANASASALDVLTAAANQAANAMSPASKPLYVEASAKQAAPSLGDFTRADRALGDGSTPEDKAAAQATADARAAVDGFSSSATTAAVDVAKLAAAAGKGGGALGLLPSIVSLFQAAVAATSAGSAASGSGGIVSAIGGFFSGGAGANAGSTASDAITSYYFHTGGVVGGSGRVGAMPSSIFDGASRYHTGGIAGGKPDGARAALAAAALKAGEVPAILMKREEVLREDDPRHRDNLGADVFARVMAGEKPWALSLAAQAAKQAPDNSVASLLKNIVGDTKQGGENSASVLGGLLSRMGVKDEPAMASALKVAGARELGGPVSAGKLYRVNEKRPELLNVAGKQYLMMGVQGGSVDANPKGADGRPIAVTNNFHLGAPTNHNTQRQMALAASRSISDAARRNG